MTQGRADHLAFSDMLRALAILCVVASHLGDSAHSNVHGLERGLNFVGLCAVDSFFVLSGFLIARPYLKALLDPGARWPSIRLFYIRRLLRVYPLYAVAVIVSLAILAVAHLPLPSLSQLGVYFLFAQNFSMLGWTPLLNAPLWTMPIDMGFYLILPLVAVALSAAIRGWGRAARLRAIVALIAVTIVGSLVYRYVQAQAHPEALHDGIVRGFFIRNGFGLAAMFAVGITLALIAIVDGRRRRPRAVYVAALGGSAVLFAIAAHLSLIWGPSRFPGTTLALTFSDLFAAGSIALLIWAFADGHFPLVTRIAASPLVSSVAGASYALYLFHLPIMRAVVNALGSPVGSGAMLKIVGISVPLMFATAYLTHIFIERPFLALKERQHDLPTRTSAPQLPEIRPAETVV